jgi:hypothetical protein
MVNTQSRGWLCSTIEPFRINKRKRVALHVRVRVQPTSQPDRVTLHILPHSRVVIPEVAAIQSAGTIAGLLSIHRYRYLSQEDRQELRFGLAFNISR